jgi:predicted amidohydrolase YtcJ
MIIRRNRLKNTSSARVAQETKPDGKRRMVIHRLNDSHMRPIRSGLNYHRELRWDGVRSLADVPRMFKEQAARAPAPQGVRVVQGEGNLST